MQRPILILLVLTFSVIALGQSDSAKRALESKLDALRDASREKQEAGPSADLQKDVKAFLNSSEVRNKNYKSNAFGASVKALRRQANDIAETLGREGPLVKAVKNLDEENALFISSIEGNLTPTPSPAASTSPSPGASPAEEDEWVFSSLSPYILPLLQGLVIFSALALLLYVAVLLRGVRSTTGQYFGGVLPQTFSTLKKGHEELAKQIDAAGLVSKEINQRLTEVHTELRLMSRMLQQVNLASSSPTNFPASYSEPSASPANDGPAFPIAADEFLRRMQHKSLVVKRDFQNDMLVSDPDGRGELVLIRDSQIAEELQPLFIVPRVTQFQMRQEYYNFYEKYYDCANPESGSVWILDPAVVEKVNGGWELREKGRLEVR
jgi:hypothetical protein